MCWLKPATRKVWLSLKPKARSGGRRRLWGAACFLSPMTVITKISPVLVLVGASLHWNRLLMRVKLWLIRRNLQCHSSFVPHCTLFSCYRPVYCRFCFCEHKCHRSPVHFYLPVSLWRGEVKVTGSSKEQWVSSHNRLRASWFDMYKTFVTFRKLKENQE